MIETIITPNSIMILKNIIMIKTEGKYIKFLLIDGTSCKMQFNNEKDAVEELDKIKKQLCSRE